MSLKIYDLAPKPDHLNSIDPPSYPDLYIRVPRAYIITCRKDFAYSKTA